ncbi:MAG TPA: hypothetical protein VMT42_05430 [candidate division Zixibacteria bacterium]|nr:hypothetical protein [candidate division Zixibacteria bacterium]
MHPALEMFTILDVWFEGRSLAKIRLRAKQLMCLFLMLTSVFLGFSFLPRAGAAMQVFSLNPVTGNVGANVTVTANLTTTNGPYNVTFDGMVEVVGNATGNNVTASFLVPEATLGNHTVTVIDLSNPTENASSVFIVLTAYYLNVTVPSAPTELQEGDSVPIFLNVTGADANFTYGAKIGVEKPDNSTYYEQLGIPTSPLGSGNVRLTYPENFSSDTHLVGTYTVSANVTDVTAAFMVGLTNSTEYHRMQTVNIKAVYASNEMVALNVSGTNIQYSVNLTADSAGVVNYSNFTVPSNTSVGTYNVNIVSLAASPTVKAIPDTQDFTVPGFAFNVTAKNLAGDEVSNATVMAYENGASVTNQTTDSNGLAVLMLEIGNYTLQGYFQDVKVGEGQFGVTNTEAKDLMLNLTDLNIKVVAIVNGTEVPIVDVGVYMTPENVTLTTNITGIAVAQSLLPNDTYTLNASRYQTPFNVTTIVESSSNNTVNGTITSLLVNGSAVPFFNVTIVCPSYTLQVQAFKADGQPFTDAVVEAKELVGGITYPGKTDSNGTVAFHNATFGTYDVEILDNAGKEINRTTVTLFQDQNVTVDCNLFHLNISVTLTDYFGQPFANTHVTLLENGGELISSRTQANGVVTFYNLVGSNYTISVYLSDQSPPTAIQSILVEGSTSVSIKMARYALVAGLPVEVNQLAVTIIIVLSVLLILVLEVYRRRKNKGQKTDG